MTCIIKKLFHATATRNTKAVRAAAHDIVARANEYAAAVDGVEGTDATREALTAADFGWMYDAIGKANKKGVSKKIMSPLSRKIKEGMVWLSDAENQTVFLWEASQDKATASLHDFANICRICRIKRGHDNCRQICKCRIKRGNHHEKQIAPIIIWSGFFSA